uniref:Thioredoxin domain-containing protein n=1 Tax=Bicosoecida sp. CB-2014 TaxID=1486930 RepID=A0A7S1CNG7_9STRA|mmetsp:Transcript_4920/g.17843  ORF Transcript_4920/g.17843 Transcript_4920/m.17843 type:complete len:426 (+) Transcript_4920:221-1498(+)|eukprot:CAMPEP_0203814916 /NCGR_PEP_ID=MMETSP0115-20131106/6703_1 /ASSEMBLY_ACC=CAM_ASM_000227 /TAXON_ID=33651 /ORGANISM="Bicosoecid sp, Strain ms1" /LENGTH=425 /DNA_ID=CAMNT_0050723801 /DNA_START=206 /DNA_END=1483 /DNA_ORIENTATION=+
MSSRSSALLVALLSCGVCLTLTVKGARADAGVVPPSPEVGDGAERATDPAVNDIAPVAPAAGDLPEGLFESVVNGSHTHLVMVYAPGLPVWNEFLPRANELAAALDARSQAARESDIDGDTASVLVHMSNVRASPSYKTRFALVEYPTLLLFPRGVTSRFFLRLPFRANSTVEELLHEVDKARLAATGVAPVTRAAVDEVLKFFEPGGTFREGQEQLAEAHRLATDALAATTAQRETIRRARSAMRTFRLRRQRKPDDFDAALKKVKGLIEQVPSQLSRANELLDVSLAIDDVAEASDTTGDTTAAWWQPLQLAEAEAERQMQLQELREDRCTALVELLDGVKKAGLRALTFISTETSKQTAALLHGHNFLKEGPRLRMLTRVVMFNDVAQSLLETDPNAGVFEKDPAQADAAEEGDGAEVATDL